MTNTEFIQQSRAICDAATDGPWEDCLMEQYVFDNDGHGPICEMRGHGAKIPPGPNMRFIAHSRTALPEALSRLERAEAVVQAAKVLTNASDVNEHTDAYYEMDKAIDAYDKKEE